MSDADVLVVGGGIAGLSAAWHAMRRRRSVVVVDEGAHRASDLPVALVNPLRGHAGRLVAGGVDGMRATLDLVDRLRSAGHVIGGGRGLFRPLVDVDGPALHRGFWGARLAGRLAFEWYDRSPASLGLRDAVPALRLPEAGWVAPAELLVALRSDSRAAVVAGRVVALAVDARGHAVATLSDGATIVARTALWCGGAWGAALLDGGPADALYKPGSLLACDVIVATEPMTFGLYAVPWADGTSIGPTREDACPTFPTDPLHHDAIERIATRVERLFETRATLRPVWRGVRLVCLSTGAQAALAGVPTLTALGSRGFLMAPLRAAAWARSL